MTAAATQPKLQVDEDQFAQPLWRLNNLYRIVNEKGVAVPFVMNDAQEALFHELHQLNTILKARQLGFTTFIQLLMLDAAVFNPNTRCGVVAHNQEDAKAFFRDKVKFPYDNLPQGIKNECQAEVDSALSLSFKNNSSLRIGTSLRSGTFQYLHISEYGKLCAVYPEKAKEVRTGALNTVHAGQHIFIESTAEGKEGHFYDLTQQARSAQRKGAVLTPLDFKFFFYPWWKHPAYVLDPTGVVIEAPYQKYFSKLEEEAGIFLTPEQQAWYVKKRAQQGDEMLREFPSTADEAFEASVEGAYYAGGMAKAELLGKISNVPYDPHVKVETWWDLGMSDKTTIWFAQRCGQEIHLIDYYENTGEGLPHYAAVLDEKKSAHGTWVYDRHVAPHDIKVRELGTGKSRLEIAQGLGIDFDICPDHSVVDGIEEVRNNLFKCWFDEARCADGIKSLKAYRKDWDEKHGTWRSKPRHDWASHASDAFRYGIMAPGGSADWGRELIPNVGTLA